MSGLRTDAKRPAGARLGLHEGIDDPRAKSCQRWPEHLRLLNHETGEIVWGRCKSTNLCDYCARLAAVETTELLWLDATEQGSPTLWLLLTTRDAWWDGEKFRRAFNAVWKAVQRRWPNAEYAALVEFTTGYGPRSGGLRRPHFNVFVRGVPVEDGDELQRVVASVWCARIDALPAQQRVTTVSEDRGGMRGLTRYVALHFLKESQAPPKGWRGQRFRASRGYFVRPRAVMRVEARRSLQVGRAVWKGRSLEVALAEVEHAATVEWSMRHVNPSTSRPKGRDPLDLHEGLSEVKGRSDPPAARSRAPAR